MDVTSAIASFIVKSRLEDFPVRAVDVAKTAMLDTIGVALAGSREDAGLIAARLVREEGSRPETTVYGQGFKAAAQAAAFANGIAAHAADYDHSFVIGGQPMAPVAPAVLALGEAIAAHGARVLEAYMTGFEVTAALAFAARGAGGGGWHANSVQGVFGATAGCAKLLSLDQERTATALAIAASMASGLTANFGTMTKPLHVGNAARTGVLAAKLAKEGFTANLHTLEARNGFFDSFYGRAADEAPLNDLGRVFALEKYGVRLTNSACLTWSRGRWSTAPSRSTPSPRRQSGTRASWRCWRRSKCAPARG
jgi:2-methylcitrate dehydratase PrpD